MFPRKISIIDDWYAQGYTTNDIVEKLRCKDLVSHSTIREKFEWYLNRIRKREENGDIKIVKFIIEHYQNEKIFYDVGHPTNFVIKEICRQILEKLTMNFALENNIFECMDGYEDLILPCVKEALHLAYGGEDAIKNGLHVCKMNQIMDLEEHVREYLFWQYKEEGADV